MTRKRVKSKCILITIIIIAYNNKNNNNNVPIQILFLRNKQNLLIFKLIDKIILGGVFYHNLVHAPSGPILISYP